MSFITAMSVIALQQSYKGSIITPFLRIQTENLNALQMSQPDYENYIDYKELAIRRADALNNMYASKSFSPCHYCDGTGYIECNFCNDGCSRCEHTTMLKCSFCGGDGEY